MTRSASMFSSIFIEKYSIFQYFKNYWNAAADSNILPAIAYEMQKESYGNLNVIWTKICGTETS